MRMVRGETEPDKLPANDEDMVLVSLSGIQAESHCIHHVDKGIEEICQDYAAARSDRGLIEENSGKAWLLHQALWHQAQYNRAQKFVQINEAYIQSLVEMILQKPAFPKCLTDSEIDSVLKTFTP